MCIRDRGAPFTFKVSGTNAKVSVYNYLQYLSLIHICMRLEGASASKIASELNRLGILSPLAYKKNNGLPYAKKGYADKADCKWSATTIIRILQDETYTGTLVQGCLLYTSRCV